MKLETPVCFFIVFYDWVISQNTLGGCYLLILSSAESSQGWDSLRQLFLAFRSVSIDRCQHTFSFDNLCHPEVGIWTYHICTVLF